MLICIMHVASLIRIRPTSYHEYSPSQLVLGTQPNISHLRIFGCAVYVPIGPTQRTKMGPQRRIRIYVGLDSPSIIKYLEPMTRDVFRARFADCHFNETVFPQLGEGGGGGGGGESRSQKDDMKSLGTHPHYPILINVLINVNWKFK